MRRPDRRLVRLAAIVVLAAWVAAATPSAHAGDPRASWLEGRAYAKQATFVASGRTVEAYVAKADDEATGPDVHRFLVVEGEEVRLAFTARATALDDATWRVRLAWFVDDVEAEPVEVAVARAETSAVAATARRLVEDALAAWASWTDASALLERAIAEASPDARRPLALAATRALERAASAHPDHAGLARDVLAAYELLLPLEAGTDRGANLSFLWRERLRTLRARFGASDDEFGALGARALATCGLAEGCYALALAGATYATTHGLAFGEEVLATLEVLGQERQEGAGSETLSTRRGELRVVAFRCPAEPPDGGIPFHRLTVLTVPPGGDAAVPTPVWYSLTDERAGERHRWALYGNVGGSRRLLRLYGATEPDFAEAKQAIHDAIRAALEAEAVR